MTRKNNRDEQGMVSFLVTMILMIVIVMIVVGFTQSSNQNRRQALDRQLSNQAFYAAESGINDVKPIIESAINGGDLASLNKPLCANEGIYISLNYTQNLNGPSLPESEKVGYTCVTVSDTPTNVEIMGVGLHKSIVTRVQSANGSNIAKLQFEWSGSENDVTGCQNLSNPADATNCQIPILRVDVLKRSGLPAQLSATDLSANTTTLFIRPNWPSGGDSASLLNKAWNIKSSPCTGASCSASITMDGTLSANDYSLRLSSLYGDVNGAVKISAYHSSDPTTPLALMGSQVIVDSTGKAKGVLRRVQARINISPAENLTNIPLSAIQADEVCKRTTVGVANNIDGGSCTD